jgi:hypothetical protein
VGEVINSSGIIFGGATATAAQLPLKYWNGTTWTEVNDLSTATDSIGNSRFRHCCIKLLVVLQLEAPTGATQSEECTAATVNSTLTAS